MTQQVIDIGSAPDDGTGDPLRISFDKTNENFTELYAKGASEGLWNYNQTSTDTSTAPVSGRFKTNSGNYRAATQIAIHATTIQGIDRSSTLRTLLVGDLIQCQDKSNAAAWCRYSLQSLPVDHGTWFQLPITFQADGGVASGDNQEIIFVFTASSGSATASAPLAAEYITSIADATLTSERVLTDTATVTWDRTVAGQIKANAVSSGVATVGPPQGRLTLQSGVPVMTTTQAAKTALLYSPYVGNLVPIYDGTNFVMTAFSELSALTTDTLKSPAAIGANKVNDWFTWSDAGTIRLGHGVDWTNDTTPVGTGPRPGLTMIGGIWTNQAAITNGPAASRGTYVGTTRSNAASQLDWIFGTSAVGGGAAFLYIWNAYNRVDVAAKVTDATATWAYGTATIRAANNSNNNRASFVSGLAEDCAHAWYSVPVSGSSGAAGIGFDSTTVLLGPSGWNGNANTTIMGNTIISSQLGAHYVQALEWANASVTFFGDSSPTIGGLCFVFKM